MTKQKKRLLLIVLILVILLLFLIFQDQIKEVIYEIMSDLIKDEPSPYQNHTWQ